MKYSCKFPQCWRSYYHVGPASTFVNLHFYRFPKEPGLQQKWKDVCRVSNENCNSYSVCENHFLEQDFVNKLRLRLNPGVTPKHLEIVPYNISILCAGDTGISFPSAISQGTISKNSDCNKDNGSLASCCSMSPDEAVPSTSANKQRNVLGNGVAKSDLSPWKSHMYKIHRNTVESLVKLKKSLANKGEKLQILKKLYEAKKFSVIEENLNSVTKSFINSQLRNAQRVPAARRWTNEDKAFALSVYKRSPRLYKYLAVQFSLPSIRPHKVQLSKIPLEPGLSPAVLKVLQSEIVKMNESDKYCCLLLDEISLEKGLHYESDKQVICGYEDLGHLGRSRKKANHALVYMLRGIYRNWKQVIAYYFITNVTSSIQLKMLICHIIGEVQKLGLKIVSSVCDLDSTNQEALKALCKENKDPSDFYFSVNREPIAVIFDVPQLLKDTRNVLIDHKIQFQPHKEAKFQYIEQVFNLDQQKKFKTLAKLKEEYFNFKDRSIKMNVKVAAAQLSHTVAADIETYVITEVLPFEAIYTAEFVDKIDNLFDSLNSSERFPQDYKKYRCALSEGLPHIKMWSNILKEIPNWKIIELATGEDRTQIFSFFNGWRTTIKSVTFMWNRLHKRGFEYLNTRAFNLDPLKNLFYSIRQQGVSKTNPTCLKFKAAIKAAILNNSASTSNNLGACEDDGCTTLSDLQQLVLDAVSHQTTVGNSENETSDVCSVPDSNLSTDKQALAYVAGYVLKRIGVGATTECNDCKNSLFSTNIVGSHVLFTVKKQDPDASHLMSVSENFMLLLKNIHDQLYAFLDNYGHTSALEDHFVSSFKLADSVKFCAKHAIHTVVLKTCVPFFIYKYTRDFKNTDSEWRPCIDHDYDIKKFRAM